MRKEPGGLWGPMLSALAEPTRNLPEQFLSRSHFWTQRSLPAPLPECCHDTPTPSPGDAVPGITASQQSHASQLQPQRRHGTRGWRSHKQRQQLAKARTAELGDLDRDQRHGDSIVFLDNPSGREPCAPSQGSHPELGCRLYLHLPRPQQEEVERLLEASGEADKGWQGLAGRLGYPADAVEVIARGQLPAHTLLRDWAVKEGSGATLRVLEDTLAAMGREDVLRVLGPPAEGCSVV
uniref:Death domain-containing membrane protein NRADD-like n=1 Tax=Canis lupus dingo TaxID=286419 RepID=A0A8C0KQZ6_CANLU